MLTHIACIASLLEASLGVSEPTTVSLQGRLSDSGSSFSGPVTLRLSLFDDADPLIGSKVDLDGDGTTQGADEDVIIRNVTVTDGLFETDFGPMSPAAFDGSPRFLQISIDDGGVITDLSRVPFRSTPGVAEVLVTPGGSAKAGEASPNGGLVLGGDVASARLDARPLGVQSAGAIASFETDPSQGQSMLMRAAGFEPIVIPGDTLIANGGGQRLFLGLALSVDDVSGAIVTDHAPSMVPPLNATLEIRQPILRTAVTDDTAAYEPGESPRTGLVVTDTGRVGINTTQLPSEHDLTIGSGGADVQGLLSASGLLIGPMGAVFEGELQAAALNGAFVETLSNGNNTTQGLIQFGDVLFQWGRFTTPSGGELTITLARPYASTLEMHGFIQSDRVTNFTNTEYTNLNVQQFEIYSQENSNGPVGSTSGHWFVIGRAP